MKPFRTTIALGAILLLLGGFYYYQAKRERPPEDKQKKVLPIADKDIQRVTLAHADQTITAERRGDGWRLVTPIDAPGDTTAIEGLLASVTGSRVERVIEERPASLKDYGLERPALTVTLEVKGASAPASLRLGDKNPGGTWLYAQRGDDPAVFLLPGTLQTELGKTVTDLRDKTLLTFDVDRVVRLTLDEGKTSIVASRDQETWALQTPVKAKADANEVMGLLRSLRYAKAKDFVSGRVPALDHPALTIRLWEKDAQQPKTVRLATGTSPNALYAAAEPGQGIVTLDPGLLKDLSKTPLQLRDRRLFVFENKDIGTIRLEAPGKPDKSLTLERSGEKWNLVQPKLGEAQELKVGDILWALRNLKFQQIVDEAGRAEATYGLDKPQLEVHITKTDGTGLPPLLIGRTEKDQVYARLQGAAPIYRLDSRFLNDLPKDAAALKKEAKTTAKK